MTNSEKAKRLRQIATKLENWCERYARTDLPWPPEMKEVTQQMTRLLLDNFALLNQAANEHGCHAPLERWIDQLKFLKNTPKNEKLGSRWDLLDYFTKQEVSAGVKMSLIDQCRRWADKLDDEPKTYNNVLKKEGNTWTVRYGGETFWGLRDTKGMHYIAYLLGKRGEDVDPRRVLLAVDHKPDAKSRNRLMDDGETVKAGNRTVGDQGLTNPDSPQEMAKQDDIGRAALLLKDTQRQQAEAVGGSREAKELDDKAKGLQRYLNEVSYRTGSGKRIPKTFATDAVKAGNAVKSAVRRAKANIKAYVPALFDHLKCLRCGMNTCSYKPSTTTEWDL